MDHQPEVQIEQRGLRVQMPQTPEEVVTEERGIEILVEGAERRLVELDPDRVVHDAREDEHASQCHEAPTLRTPTRRPLHHMHRCNSRLRVPLPHRPFGPTHAA
jgi:hypothetical protein